MKKILKFISDHVLFLVTLFFIVFIPLYPKLPLLDVQYTWVYIRIEDFLVSLAAILFLIQWVRKRTTIKTPLTWPIVLFWFVGAIATLNGVLFIFPHLQGVFPQLALLYFLRHIEYLLLYFVAFSAIREKKFATPLVITFAVTVLLVFLYGIGQRYLGFPAFLTMNEEFAKGIPLKLSPLSRIPSTFAGHYDLAAYLTLMIPFMGSMVFGYKKWWAKVFFVLTTVAGLILLLMTASRVSFAVYLLTITFVLILQKKKLLIIPVIILSILLLQSFQGISQRFASTITQVDVVVDARTGKAIGIADNFTDDGKVVLKNEESTGENLPQGSKYIIPSGGKGTSANEVYVKNTLKGAGNQMIGRSGNVIVKKAFAYDVSFTTRFQGEWPRALDALKRNLLLGSGYSSINLATDNNFLRMLGETGFAGFLAFLSIFLVFFIYVRKVLPHVTDPVVKSMAFGVSAGIFGLLLNAVLIDVFEASKVAFILWTLLGVMVGLLHLYQKEKIDYLKEMRKIFLSVPALISYLVVIGLLIFAKSFTNYFVADDFTWLRWAVDCSTLTGNGSCLSFIGTIMHYFTDAQNFFYRPGTKSYFFVVFPFFDIFPLPYHLVSFFLHLSAVTLTFFITSKLLKSRLFGFIGALIFLTLSVNAEAVYWISVTGHLLAYDIMLFAFLIFMYWKENRNIFLFALILLSIFTSTWFYESAVTLPLLLLGYDVIMQEKWKTKELSKKWYYLVFLLFIPLYYLMRTAAHSFVMQGNYSYNLHNLPVNIVGNLFGYLMITLFGTVTLPFYETIRTNAAQSLPLILLCLVIGLLVLSGAIFLVRQFVTKNERIILYIALLLFIIPLLLDLGLGNIASRYAYVSAVGVVLFLTALLQKTLSAFSKPHYRIGLLLILVVTAAYCFYNLKYLNKINTEWEKAGNITNNLLTDLNINYNAPGALPRHSVFYFVNTPMKYGEAWVFPVGLQDGIWFTFRENPVQVKQAGTLEQALTAHDADPTHVKVFEFQPDGSIALVNRNPNLKKKNAQ